MVAAFFDTVHWEDLGVGVAAILGMVYIARVLARVLKDTMSGVTERQTEMLQWFGNHLSNLSSSMESTAVSLQRMSDNIEVLHDDNVETARELRMSNEAWRSEMRYFRLKERGIRAEGDVERTYEGERGEPKPTLGPA
jgi:hypothetical protein